MSDPDAPIGTALVAHPGAELYGSDRMMLETVQALIERRWRVVVAVPNDGPLVEEAQRLGAETVFVDVPVLRKALLRPTALAGSVVEAVTASRRIDRLLADLRPRVVYVSTVTVPLWVERARAHRIPVVCHVHESERGAPKLLRRLIALPLLRATSVLVNSRFSRDGLLDVVPSLAARSTVVYNGVAAGSATPARRELTDRVRLVYVGRLSPRKGVDVAVDALALLVQQGVDAELTLVGSIFSGYEWYRQQLADQIERQGLRGRVRFAGFRPEVWSSLAEADIALVPSREEEPFGNTAVEALLAGRPCVVSAIGGLPEAVAGFSSAVSVLPGDAGRLAEGVQRILQNWGAFRTSAIALAPMAANRFSPETYRTAVADHLARVAHVPHAAAPDLHGAAS